MSMSYSDHVCTNFEPLDSENWESELKQHLCKEIDELKIKADKLAEALELIRKHGCDDSHAWLNAEQALKRYK